MSSLSQEIQWQINRWHKFQLEMLIFNLLTEVFISKMKFVDARFYVNSQDVCLEKRELDG